MRRIVAHHLSLESHLTAVKGELLSLDVEGAPALRVLWFTTTVYDPTQDSVPLDYRARRYGKPMYRYSIEFDPAEYVKFLVDDAVEDGVHAYSFMLLSPSDFVQWCMIEGYRSMEPEAEDKMWHKCFPNGRTNAFSSDAGDQFVGKVPVKVSLPR